MICPFCLEKVKFEKQFYDDGKFSYVCPDATCGQLIPRLYVEEYRQYPPIVVSVIGHRAHGKTVALSTLYFVLSRMNLGAFWPGFYLFPINEPSLEVVFENAKSLESGKLPPPNPKIFPEPTLLQVNNVPLAKQGKATFLFYDTAGEAFLRTQDIGRYAGFVRRAGTVLFLVSIPRLKEIKETSRNPAGELERLLYSYIQGMADMNADTRNQHLIVVYTCADALLPEFERWPHIERYILEDDWYALTDSARYVGRMHNISDELERFTREYLRAGQFLSLANDRFQSVHFSIISALGAAPDVNGQLTVKIKPRRILDPLFWTLERALPPRRQRKYQRFAATNRNTMVERRKITAPSKKESKPVFRFLSFWKSLFQ